MYVHVWCVHVWCRCGVGVAYLCHHQFPNYGGRGRSYVPLHFHDAMETNLLWVWGAGMWGREEGCGGGEEGCGGGEEGCAFRYEAA